MNNYKKYIVLLIAGVGLAFLILYLVPWGNAESEVVKTGLDKNNLVKIKSISGIELYDLSVLKGAYRYIENTNKVTSEIMFEIDGMKETIGKFKKFSIDLKLDDDYTTGQLDITIDPSSIFTDNDMRDESLLEEEFFNVAMYPDIKYSSKIISIGDTSYISHGEISMIGVTKELPINFLFDGIGEDDKGNDIAVFKGEFKFDRTQFGMSETTSVGNEVKVSFYTELILIK